MARFHLRTYNQQMTVRAPSGKESEHNYIITSAKELMFSNCGAGEDSFESPLGSKELKPVHPKGNQPWIIHWKDWCWSWSSNSVTTWCREPTHWKRPWCWERLKAGWKGDDRGWDGWMASLTRWTWVWANSRRWWRTGNPGMLQSMGSQRAWHDLETKQQ